MKSITLLTYRNSLYRDPLLKAGYSIIEYNLPTSDNDILELSKISGCDYSIIEVDDDILRTARLFDVACEKGKIICIINRMTDKTKSFLLDRGISDVIQNKNGKYLVSYLKVIEEDEIGESGKILVLDDNEINQRIFKNLFDRFGYITIFVDSIDGLFDNINKIDLQFILINLGTKKLDLNGLIKRSSSNTQMKRVPLITYKDMQKEFFVHEIISGLNRLSGFILSLNEVYSFLVDILFKKDIMPLVATLNRTIDFENYAHCAREPLSRIFLLNKNKIFDSDSILNGNTFHEMTSRVNLIKKSLLKADGLKWLMIELNKKDVNTAGMGV